MQREILLWCVGAPAAVSLACLLLAFWVARREHWLTQYVVPAIATLGWCAAIAVTLVIRQEFDASALSWWNLEAWQQIHVPLTLTALFLALTATPQARAHEFRWVAATLGCIALAMVAMPSGEGWVDLFPEHRAWMAAVAGASLLNLWMLDQMSRRGTERWILLVALAGLAGPTILAATAYAGLAEWGFAAIVATLVFAVGAACLPKQNLWCVAYPATLFAVCTTAAGRFYTYEDHPAWLYGLLLLTPSCIGAVDWILRNRPTYARIAVAAVLAGLIIGVAAWFLLARTSQY
ncbi:hypothetical protein [Allorhodopirellula heiligendammensis]|uniref:MraY-like glycosyltransferase n=1 Tax=Allorhodopirellula heiligendammensis TaxID=2714739 RepID=A0A5C6BFA7_9BACT|nr:hypothetical protein [Allorhodopirellula heiligendammensis]TWU09986.1 MraY-like glycosyltransferase [Allorhodopirellula heiligendammensis]